MLLMLLCEVIESKNNERKIYEIGGPKIISFGDMVKSIMKTLNKKKICELKCQ